MEGMETDCITSSDKDIVTQPYDILNRTIIKQNLLCVIFLAVLVPLGTVGNISVLVIFTRHYKHTVFRFFVQCLAVVDLCISVIGIPYEILEISFRFNYTSEMTCKIFNTLKYFLLLFSVSLLFGLSLDRFRHVMSPLKNQMTALKAKIICLFTLSASFAASLPLYFFVRIRDARCDIIILAQEQKYYALIGAFVFMIGTLCLIIMYICMVVKIYRQRKFRMTFSRTILKDSTPRTPRIGKNAGQMVNKMTLISLTICVVFIISFSPFLIIFNTIPLDTEEVYICIMLRLIYINSVANPIIYGFLDQRFRCFLKEYFTTRLGLQRRMEI